jgi:hypothetical protein
MEERDVEDFVFTHNPRHHERTTHGVEHIRFSAPSLYIPVCPESDIKAFPKIARVSRSKVERLPHFLNEAFLERHSCR